MSNRVALEAEFAGLPDAEMGAVVPFESTIWGFSGNVLYHFTATNVSPYVTAGPSTIGVNTNLEDAGLLEDDTEWNLGFNWGAGLKSALSDRFGVRGDLGYFTGDDLVPDHWRLYGGVVLRRIGQ